MRRRETSRIAGRSHYCSQIFASFETINRPASLADLSTFEEPEQESSSMREWPEGPLLAILVYFPAHSVNKFSDLTGSAKVANGIMVSPLYVDIHIE